MKCANVDNQNALKYIGYSHDGVSSLTFHMKQAIGDDLDNGEFSIIVVSIYKIPSVIPSGYFFLCNNGEL